jgi:hypothetical protein
MMPEPITNPAPLPRLPFYLGALLVLSLAAAVGAASAHIVWEIIALATMDPDTGNLSPLSSYSVMEAIANGAGLLFAAAVFGWAISAVRRSPRRQALVMSFLFISIGAPIGVVTVWMIQQTPIGRSDYQEIALDLCAHVLGCITGIAAGILGVRAARCWRRGSTRQPIE